MKCLMAWLLPLLSSGSQMDEALPTHSRGCITHAGHHALIVSTGKQWCIYGATPWLVSCCRQCPRALSNDFYIQLQPTWKRNCH